MLFDGFCFKSWWTLLCISWSQFCVSGWTLFVYLFTIKIFLCDFEKKIWLPLRYSWRDPLGRFGMTQFVDVGPETTIWTFDPLCWSTNLLLCKKNPNVHFVVSPILSDTICWFGSNNESTIYMIHQFCWCGRLFLKSIFLTVDKFCWFVVDTESTIFVNWPDLTKSTDRLTFTQNNLLDG